MRSYRFSIPEQSLTEAAIDFASQANLSIAVNGCKGRSSAVSGRYTIDTALPKLLSGTGCSYRWVTKDTISLFAEPNPVRSVPSPGSRPSAHEKMAPQEITEVVVTVTKRAAAVDQLPYAISALSSKAIQSAGARDLFDIIAQVPGVSTTNLGPGRDKIMLRGLSDGIFTGRTQSTVGIYLDNTPITYNAPDPDLRLADVEAVELIRGPQGSLYGSGSLNGLYRIVTHKPVMDEWAGSVRAGGALTNAGAPSSELEGLVNIPFASGRAAARVVAYDELEGGYIEDLVRRLKNVGGSSRVGGRGAVSAMLGGNWLASANMAFQTIQTNDTQYISRSRFRRASAVREYSRNEFSHAVLTLENSGSWGRFTSSTSIISHDLTSYADASTALPLFGRNAGYAGSYAEPIGIRTLSEDAVWTSSSGRTVTWLLGLYGSSTEQTTAPAIRTLASASTPAQVLYAENRVDRRNEFAAYGEGSYALGHGLILTAGGRMSFTALDTGSAVTAPLTKGLRLFSGHKDFGVGSPKLALAYEWENRGILYASMSEGNRVGGFNTGGRSGLHFAQNGQSPGIHRAFTSDELWNIEAGAKLTAMHGRLRLRTALFYDLWENIQTDQFTAAGISYTTNAGNARNLGWEAEILFRPNTYLTFQSTSLLNEARLTHTAPGFFAGSRLPGVPQVQVGSRATLTWPLSPSLSASLGVEANYVGRSALTFNPLVKTPMGDYVLARLSAQIEGRTWRLAAFLSNPANDASNTFSYGNPFIYRQAPLATPERPRSLRILLSKDF